ncbi:MAG TPA: hypothetical protein VGE47_10385 [Burkholderiaceae bacterium]
MNFLKYLASMLIALTLAACGGGDGDGNGADTEPPVPIASNGSGTFNANTRLMAAADLVGASLDGNTLTVRKPQATTHAVGTVLVVDGFGGHLVRITGVQESATEIRYSVEQASLAQAFASLDVKFDGELTAADLGESFVTNDPEVEIGWRNATALQPASARDQARDVAIATNTLEIKYKKMGGQVGSGIEIDGSSSFMLNPDFSLSLNKRPGDTLPSLDMSAVLSPALQTSLSVASLYGGQVSYTLDKNFPLKPFKRIIIVPVAGIPVPVPFWIKPVITLSGGVNGTAGSKFTTTYGYGVSGSMGFTRTGAAGFDGVATMSSTSDLNVSDVESEFGVTLSAPKMEIQFLIYSAAGPNFELGFESSMVGKGTVKGTPPVEGVGVKGDIKFKGAVGLKGGLDFSQIDGVKALLGDVSFSYTPISVTVFAPVLVEREWFFPYTGQASVRVNDNGSAADDIFEIALDGTVLGRTNKGGSGQFRLKDLRPGRHSLTLTTVEDDSPPGTYEITLADGLTFTSGGTYTSGSAYLGETKTFSIEVPATPAP